MLFRAALVAHLTSIVVTVVRYDGKAIAKSWFADDAFYYLEVANHIAAGHGSTFDGSAATNGYHPLWLLVCSALAWFVPRDGQVQALFVMQGLLVGLSAQLLRVALRPVHELAANIAPALLLAAVGMRGTLMNGMESALGMTFLCALLWFTLRLPGGRIALSTPGQAWAAWALLGGVALSRLEMGLVPALWLAGGFWCARGATEGRRSIWLLAGVAGGLAATAGAYVLVNLWIAEWPVPISGSVKWSHVETSDVFWNTVRTHALAFVALLRPLLGLMAWWFLVVASAVLLPAMIWLLVSRLRDRLAYAVHVAAAVAFVAIVIRRSGGFAWYGWPALFLGVLATFAVMAWAEPRLLRGPRVKSIVLAVLATFCFVSPIGRALRPRPVDLFDWVAPEALWDATLAWLRDRVPASDVVSGTCVGHLSFASQRSIVQVEGLVNDRAYLEALRRGDAAGELQRRGVQWLVGPVQHRDNFDEVLGGYCRPEDVESVTWITTLAGLDLGTTDDVAIVRFRKGR